MNELEMFRCGMDTYDIALELRQSEALTYNRLVAVAPRRAPSRTSRSVQTAPGSLLGEGSMVTAREMKWHPIDTAPRNGTSILVCNDWQPGVDMVSWKGGKKRGGWATEDGTAQYGEGIFTHWMPLPLAINEKPNLRLVVNKAEKRVAS